MACNRQASTGCCICDIDLVSPLKRAGNLHMTDSGLTVTSVSSAEFSKDVDHYINEANKAHRVFEVSGPREQSVVVLSRQDFEGWQETIYLLSSQANAQILLESIAELDAK
jgi:antitoxin YefM